MKKIYFIYSVSFSFILTVSIVIYTIFQKNNLNIKKDNFINIKISGAFKYPGIKMIEKDKSILDVLNQNKYFYDADIEALNLKQKVKINMEIYLPFKKNIFIKINDLDSEIQIINRGINKNIAKLIFENKNNYKDWNQILLIKGVGEKTLIKLKSFLIL